MAWPFVEGGGEDSWYNTTPGHFLIVAVFMLILWTVWDLVIKTDSPLVWVWNQTFGRIGLPTWDGYQDTAPPLLQAVDRGVGRIRATAKNVDATGAAMEAAVAAYKQKQGEAARGPEQFTEMPPTVSRVHLQNTVGTRDLTKVIKHDPLPSFEVNPSDSGTQTALRFFNPPTEKGYSTEFEDEWIGRDRRVIDDAAHAEGRALFPDEIVL